MSSIGTASGRNPTARTFPAPDSKDLADWFPLCEAKRATALGMGLGGGTEAELPGDGRGQVGGCHRIRGGDRANLDDMTTCLTLRSTSAPGVVTGISGKIIFSTFATPPSWASRCQSLCQSGRSSCNLGTCCFSDRRKNQFPVKGSRPLHAHSSRGMAPIAAGVRCVGRTMAGSGAMPTASKEHAPGSAIRGWVRRAGDREQLGTATPWRPWLLPDLDGLLLRLLRLSRLAFRQLVAEVLRRASGSSTAARGAAVHTPGAPWPRRPGRASAARTPTAPVCAPWPSPPWPSPTAPRSAGRMNPGRSCSTATCSPPAVTPAPPGWDPPSPWTTAPCPPTA